MAANDRAMFAARLLRTRLAPVCLAAAVCLLVLTGSASAASAIHPHRDHGRGHWFKPTCAVAAKGFASCNAQIVTNANGTPLASNTPPAGARSPAQFASAYALPTTAAASATIAIVDAYDNPNAESDLASYSSFYGLPACTTANGCFRKVSQTGSTTYPQANSSWGLEIALDVDTAHAICQHCKILLVEAASPSFSNLGAAENEAVKLGASVVSNSWGGSESSSETLYDSTYFNHPGVIMTASTGDSGYGVEYPAASPNLVAVGGTTLNLNPDNSYKNETAWVDAGSGCSSYETKPASQNGVGCAKRAVADVSADADPNTGAAIYDTFGYSGWIQVGGTSLSSPLIAAVFALSGNTSNGTAPYANRSALHDVTSGSNGSCGGTSLCTAGVGYDGPTGLGTPNGLAAFGGAPAAPDFSFGVSPSSQTVTQGGSTTYTVTMTPNSTFTSGGSVAVSTASAPGDVTFSGCASALTAASPSCTLTVTTSPSTAASSHALTITGTGDGTLPAHSAGATLAVQAPLAPDFSLGIAPSTQTVTQGGSTTYTVTLTPNSAFTSTSSVSLGESSAPGDVSFSGCASALTAASPSCTLTVTTSGSTAASSHALTVTGTGSGTLPAHSAGATLVVQAPVAPDFSLGVTPSTQTVTQGGSTTYTVTLSPNSTFGAGSVSVAPASTPADVSFSGCASALTAASPTCTLTATTTSTTAISSHTLTVTGTGSGSLPAHSAGATLVVQSAQVAVGDFALQVSPSNQVLFTPGSATFQILITRLQGFTGPIALSVTGLPAGYTATFSPNPATTAATLTITATKSSLTTIRFTVTGTSGSLVHTATGSVTVF